jgi:hypothetical protein
VQVEGAVSPDADNDSQETVFIQLKEIVELVPKIVKV